MKLDEALDWLSLHGYDLRMVLDILPNADWIVDFVEKEMSAATPLNTPAVP